MYEKTVKKNLLNLMSMYVIEKSKSDIDIAKIIDPKTLRQSYKKTFKSMLKSTIGSEINPYINSAKKVSRCKFYERSSYNTRRFILNRFMNEYRHTVSNINSNGIKEFFIFDVPNNGEIPQTLRLNEFEDICKVRNYSMDYNSQSNVMNGPMYNFYDGVAVHLKTVFNEKSVMDVHDKMYKIYEKRKSKISNSKRSEISANDFTRSVVCELVNDKILKMQNSLKIVNDKNGYVRSEHSNTIMKITNQHHLFLLEFVSSRILPVFVESLYETYCEFLKCVDDCELSEILDWPDSATLPQWIFQNTPVSYTSNPHTNSAFREFLRNMNFECFLKTFQDAVFSITYKISWYRIFNFGKLFMKTTSLDTLNQLDVYVNENIENLSDVNCDLKSCYKNFKDVINSMKTNGDGYLYSISIPEQYKLKADDYRMMHSTFNRVFRNFVESFYEMYFGLNYVRYWSGVKSNQLSYNETVFFLDTEYMIKSGINFYLGTHSSLAESISYDPDSSRIMMFISNPRYRNFYFLPHHDEMLSDYGIKAAQISYK